MNCQYCGAPASINTQKVWIAWEYNFTTGEYSRNYNSLVDTAGPTGNDNLHFCLACFDNWKNGSVGI